VDQWFWSLFGEQNVSLPRAETVAEYAASVPEDFAFTVKVPNSITLTHFYHRNKDQPLRTNPHFLSPELFKTFLENLTPLGQRVKVLMFQFEYLNRSKMSSQQEFQTRLAEFFDAVPRVCAYALEPRNPRYLNAGYLRFLNENRLRHVFLQGYYMPDITGIYWKHPDLLQGLTVVRLHGYDRDKMEARAGKKWDSIVAPKDDELGRVAKMLDDLLSRKIDVYVNVNNHYEGSAPLTIDKLNGMLGKIP
jgi:uncharacterized protein YecE (DUF72 family)